MSDSMTAGETEPSSVEGEGHLSSGGGEESCRALTEHQGGGELVVAETGSGALEAVIPEVQGQEPSSETEGNEELATQPKETEGAAVEDAAAPQEEPAAPQEEPAAPQEEPAAPSEGPTTPSEEPAAPQEKPSTKAGSGKAQGRSPDPVYQALLDEVDALPDAVQKLGKVIEFMEVSLAQAGGPQLRNFWEARRLCLQLFKENITPVVRVHLWARYNELSQEARRLKEILDEQSAFAVEQIDIAITALEGELEQFDQQLTKAPDFEFPGGCETLKSRHSFYSVLQKELVLLNAHASRINALRKELIKTDMRIRQKNKFFQRLSQAGDKVFPRRKELIKEVSEGFIADVDAFVEECLGAEVKGQALFVLREEIKGLQATAKALTLNSRAFGHSRTQLSRCWDKVKEFDKERKKERAQRRQVSKENAEGLRQKIQEAVQDFKEEKVSLAEAASAFDGISALMRITDLDRVDVRILREELSAARQPIFEKNKEQEKARKEQAQAKERQRAEAVEALEKGVEVLIVGSGEYDLDQFTNQRDALRQEFGQLKLSSVEKRRIERQFKLVEDVFNDKQEQALLALSDDDREALTQLREVLKKRKDRRKEIKEQLEELRKGSGAYGLDFEKAMTYREQIEAERERLEKLDSGIEEVRGKIREVKAKVSG